MTTTKQNNTPGILRYQTVVQTFSLIALVFGVAGMFIIVGRKDFTIEQNSNQIQELRGISQDLVKSQVLGSANDNHYSLQLLDLKHRIERLEDND